ncbi:hypothetical protein I7I48_03885 [Histoplasma ohiense]|nr:hypothetical protein I7I48_03885 [Histoplasma ohiense (nom. inval.)]
MSKTIYSPDILNPSLLSTPGISLPMLHIHPTPTNAIILESSRSRISNTLSTPSRPPKLRPHNAERPTSVKSAPNANALNASLPLVIPLSIMTGTLPRTALTISGSTSILEGTESSWRPSLLDTMIASAPCPMASSVSSAVIMPFRMIFRLVLEHSQGMVSDQVSDASFRVSWFSSVISVAALAFRASRRIRFIVGSAFGGLSFGVELFIIWWRLARERWGGRTNGILLIDAIPQDRCVDC